MKRFLFLFLVATLILPPNIWADSAWTDPPDAAGGEDTDIFVVSQGGTVKNVTRAQILEDLAAGDSAFTATGVGASTSDVDTKLKQIKSVDDYPDLATAVTAQGATTTLLIGSISDMTIADGVTVTIPSTMTFQWAGGLIQGTAGGGTETIAINGGFVCPDEQQAFEPNVSVTINSVNRVSAMWGGALSDGSNDDTAEIQLMVDALTGGGTLYFPKGSSYYKISDTVDFDTVGNITIEFDPGAEVRLSAADKDGFNTDQDWITFKNVTMRGEGTFVTSGTSGKSLIVSSGDHTTIEKAYLKEPEQRGIEITGDYPTLKEITIEGGPYFADAGDIGTDRQHYGAHITGSINPIIDDFKVIPNADANAGIVIQGLLLSSTANPPTGATISHINIGNTWDHCIYAAMEGSSISDFSCNGSGIKIEMAGDGTAEKGNTITNGEIVVDDQSGPLAGDSCLTLIDPKWSTFSNIGMHQCGDSAIAISTAESSAVITGNTVSNISVDGVIDGIGDQGELVRLDNSNIDEFSYNVFSNITGSDIGEDDSGECSAFQIQPADTDDHVGNIFSHITLNNVQENGFLFLHLTGTQIDHVTGTGIGLGTPGSYSMINASDLQRSKISDVLCNGDGATTAYCYRESSSGYNELTNITAYNMATAPFRTSGFGTTNTIRGATNGLGDVSTYTTAGDRTIANTDLWQRTHLRDPNGAARADTLPTANSINSEILLYDGAQYEITYLNTGEGAETITITTAAGLTIYNNEGADDAVIPAGCGATLRFVRTSSTTVSLFVTVFEDV